MSMSIDQISAIAAKDIAAVTADTAINNSAINNPMQNQGTAFVDVLQNGVAEVNQTLHSATVQLERLALGEPISTHELMITMEKAKLQLQLGIEVRNKLVEAYQELMRMPL